MANNLDLQEQEQLDALKAFWARYGNLITWTLVLVLGGFAAWNGWNWWQREQGAKAGALFEELDRAVATGDLARVAQAQKDLQERFSKTVVAQHGALGASRLQAERGQADAAKASLKWAAENGPDAELRVVARLRLAGSQADAKQFDEALKTLSEIDAGRAASFAALIEDRRGDVLQAQGKKAEAVAAYQRAFAAMGEKVDYRRLVEAKLGALGALPPAAAASAAAPASGARP